MSKADIAVLLALWAALASASGDVIRQRSAHEITDEHVGHLELFRMSLRDVRWWLGGGGAVANYGLLAGALALGSVMLVTALQVTALLFALPIYARLTHDRVTRWEWMWAAGLAVALAVVVIVGDPAAGHARGSLQAWMVVAVIMGPLLVLCVLGAEIWRGRPPARQCCWRWWRVRRRRPENVCAGRRGGGGDRRNCGPGPRRGRHDRGPHRAGRGSHRSQRSGTTR
jgi:drug/metabolite transporter (DMT)-like permease